jgi:hypothetical protein
MQDDPRTLDRKTLLLKMALSNALPSRDRLDLLGRALLDLFDIRVAALRS